MKNIKKQLFLDRDGVINEDIGYLHKIKDFIWVKGAIKALKTLKEKQFFDNCNFKPVRCWKRFFQKKHVNDLHKWINKQLIDHRVQIDDFFFSTEHPDENKENSRRKPSPVMINEAVKKYNLNKSKCFMLGDKENDVLTAKNASIKGFLFKGGDLSDKIDKILKYHL